MLVRCCLHRDGPFAYWASNLGEVNLLSNWLSWIYMNRCGDECLPFTVEPAVSTNSATFMWLNLKYFQSVCTTKADKTAEIIQKYLDKYEFKQTQNFHVRLDDNFRESGEECFMGETVSFGCLCELYICVWWDVNEWAEPFQKLRNKEKKTSYLGEILNWWQRWRSKTSLFQLNTVINLVLVHIFLPGLECTRHVWVLPRKLLNLLTAFNPVAE